MANQQPRVNPLNILVNQMAQLVWQMQVAQPPQINVLVAYCELNLVPYSEFAGGDQDLISLLENVEKAFEANRINNTRKIPVIISKLKGSASIWWETIKHQVPLING